MTNVEFQEKLNKLYAEFPIIARSKKKTINELIFILRQDNDVEDYCLNIDSESEGFSFGMLKECFFPVRHLALKIDSLEYEEDEESPYPILVAHTN